MRTSKQKLYDKMYYGIEMAIGHYYANRRIRKSMRKETFDKDFYKAYKEKVVPYWAQFGIKPNINWFKYYYKLTGVVDPHYIPDDIHHFRLIPHFNDYVYRRALTDKNFHAYLFPGVKRPETIYKKVCGTYRNDDFTVISQEEAFSRLEADGKYIIKPSTNSGSGSDIQFFTGIPGEEEWSKLLSSYGDNDYIVQRILSQHPAIASFNPTSVNTIRVVTLFFNGKPHILSAILRIGQKGSLLDNIAKGGYQAIVRPDGTLDKYAYTHNNGIDKHVEQTISGNSFEGFTIPSWDKIRNTALTLAGKLPYFRFIGWDFAVDETGDVVLIEFNCRFNPNQENCGPTFGDMTDEVLTQVFGSRRKK